MLSSNITVTLNPRSATSFKPTTAPCSEPPNDPAAAGIRASHPTHTSCAEPSDHPAA